MISLKLTARSESFKADFQRWLSSNLPPRIEKRVELERFVEISRAWQQRLANERWVGVHWPEAYGGRGLSLVEEALIQECLAAVGSPQLINLFGLTMVGPVLIAHGTEAQKVRFLAKILSAEEIWCQGFSEPEAGSDLSAVRTKAERQLDGDGALVRWELTGQKVWTSFAQVADWCFILARSNPEQPRYSDLSYFLMQMSQAGIEVRPLTQISGDREFNELFLDGVAVSPEHLVGREGEGWKIAISTLMYERVVLTFARHLQSESALNDLRDLLRADAASAARPAAATTFGRLHAHSMAVRALALSHLLSYENGSPAGPEGSLDKLGWSETFQEICIASMEALGARSVITGGAEAHLDGLLQHNYLYSRGRTIAAGTSEIQRGIIAERLLGLPREGKAKGK